MNSTEQSSGMRARTKALKVSRDLLRILVADEAEGDLAARLAGDHGLGALARIAADDAVHVAGRTRLDLLDQHAALLAGGMLQADLAEEFLLP